MRTAAGGMASPLGGLTFIRSELRRGRSRRVRGLEWYSTERGLGLVSSRGIYSMPEAGGETASGARTATGCSWPRVAGQRWTPPASQCAGDALAQAASYPALQAWAYS